MRGDNKMEMGKIKVCVGSEPKKKSRFKLIQKILNKVYGYKMIWKEVDGRAVHIKADDYMKNTSLHKMNYYIVDSTVHCEMFLAKAKDEEEALDKAIEKIKHEDRYEEWVVFNRKEFVAIEVSKLIETRLDTYNDCVTLL